MCSHGPYEQISNIKLFLKRNGYVARGAERPGPTEHDTAVLWTPTDSNVSDAATKALGAKKFRVFREQILGHVRVPLPQERKVQSFAAVHMHMLQDP